MYTCTVWPQKTYLVQVNFVVVTALIAQYTFVNFCFLMFFLYCADILCTCNTHIIATITKLILLRLASPHLAFWQRYLIAMYKTLQCTECTVLNWPTKPASCYLYTSINYRVMCSGIACTLSFWSYGYQVTRTKVIRQKAESLLCIRQVATHGLAAI